MRKEWRHPQQVAWKVPEFCPLAKVSQRQLYNFPPDLQPKSVWIGKARIIIEPPDVWLARVGNYAAVRLPMPATVTRREL
jgi:hypothetical protein